MIGYFGTVWIVLAILVSLARQRRPAFPALLAAVSVWTADILVVVLKAVVERPRPAHTIPQADPLMSAGGYSFPSGHAATAFAGAVVLAYLAPRGAPYFFLLAAAIAYSRVYVGVHYPGDVLAGAALGAVVAIAWIFTLDSPLPSGEARPRSRSEPPAG